MIRMRSARPMSKPVHRKRRYVVVLSAVALALAGCSGSDSDAQDEVAVRPSPSFAATNALSQRLLAEAVTLDPVRAVDLPVTGTATYRGAVSYVDGNVSDIPDDLEFPDYETFIVNNADYVSEIRMSADFGDDSVDGSIGGFRNSNNVPFRIGLTFRGQITSSSDDTAAFVGTLDGTNEFENAEGETESKMLSGPIVGNFLGPRAETVLGTLAITKGFTGEELGDVFGVFTAVQ
jgi:hypothetical protein